MRKIILTELVHVSIPCAVIYLYPEGSFSKVIMKNVYLLWLQQYSQLATVDQIGGVNVPSFAAMEQTRKLAHTLAQNDDPKFQVHNINLEFFTYPIAFISSSFMSCRHWERHFLLRIRIGCNLIGDASLFWCGVTLLLHKLWRFIASSIVLKTVFTSEFLNHHLIAFCLECWPVLCQ